MNNLYEGLIKSKKEVEEKQKEQYMAWLIQDYESYLSNMSLQQVRRVYESDSFELKARRV